MPSSTTLGETTRSPLDATEYVRLATTGANWKAQLAQIWPFGGLYINSTTDNVVDGSNSTRVQIATGTVSPVIAATIGQFSADASGSTFRFSKSRNATIGSETIVQNNDSISQIDAWGADSSTTYARATAIRFQVDAAPSSGIVPGRIVFMTATSAGALTEVMRLNNTGAAFLPTIGTTASAANAFIDNASSPVNNILRSTSSRRYKTDESDIPSERLAALRKLKPIEFNSLASADNPDKRFVGYAAEDVAEIDEVLVNRDAEGRPDGVQYDRVLLMLVADLQKRIAKLETELAERRA